VVHDLISQNFTGCHVIAVAKASGKNNYLKLFKEFLVLYYSVYMDAFRFGAGQLQRVLGLHIAIYSRRP
jgi:hypothetical protein